MLAENRARARGEIPDTAADEKQEEEKREE
jgi:hypothetical protein